MTRTDVGDESAVPDGSDVKDYFSTLSNWGRWGPDDQLGTLNFLGTEERIAAAQLVRDGVSIGCGRPIGPTTATASEPVLHFMMSAGAEMPPSGTGSSGDWFGMYIHGYTVSHIDAHSHAAWDRQLYNGRDAVRSVTAAGGAAVGNMEPTANGVVGRGVLLDLARARGDSLAAGTAFSADDLNECARRQSVDIRRGDVLLVRFGNPRLDLASTRPAKALEGEGPLLSGLDASCLPWLHRSEVAVLGSDAISDRSPSLPGSVPMPIHAVGIVAMGLWIMDNLQLDALGTACADRGRWEFQIAVAPLRLQRATGCPVNPIAIF